LRPHGVILWLLQNMILQALARRELRELPSKKASACAELLLELLQCELQRGLGEVMLGKEALQRVRVL
jgi:hypothetical protein